GRALLQRDRRIPRGRAGRPSGRRPPQRLLGGRSRPRRPACSALPLRAREPHRRPRTVPAQLPHAHRLVLPAGAGAARVRTQLRRAGAAGLRGRPPAGEVPAHRRTAEIAFIDTALYHYRRRGDGSSTMQAAKADPRRYTDVLEHGTLDLLQHAQQVKGRVPDWVQYEVIYDLAWIYRTEDALHGVHQGLSQEVCDRF